MYPELHSKLDKILDYGLFYALVFWFIGNVLITYTVYFDSSSIGIVTTIFHASIMVFMVFWFSRWMKTIAVKQNVSFIQFDRLTTDEYAVLSYILPLIISAIAQLLYSLISGEISWQNRSQTGLIVHMAIVHTLHMSLIRKFFINIPCAPS